MSSVSSAAPAPAAPSNGGRFWRDLWIRTALTGLLIVVGVFGAYEMLEITILQDASVATLHRLHIVRGMSSSFLLATWAFASIRRARLEVDAKLEESVRVLEGAVRERTRDLEEAQAFTELLFCSLRERIIVTDPEGRVLKENHGENDPPAPPPSAVETRADAAGRVWEVETLTVPDVKDGTWVRVEVGRDVTERRALEAQVLHHEKMASLGLLAGGIAHDLGNPLASLSSELELLEGEDDLARVRASLDVLRRHVGRISRSLREMVDFARRRRDEVADVSIPAAVVDSTQLVRHDPRWRKIELVTDLPADLPAIRMVEDQLVMVLVNLMLNAADAMPEGGTLTISAGPAAGAVELHLRDTGAGMAPDVLAQAMTPLFTTKTRGERRGTGLGLSVCRRVIQGVGGDIGLTSEPGKGTLVTVRLPAARGSHG